MSDVWIRTTDGDLIRADEVRQITSGDGLRVVLVGGSQFMVADVEPRAEADTAAQDLAAAMSEARYHIPVSVAYDGFDELIFRPLPPDPALRERFAPANAPLLLFAGRLVTFKGIDHLLDALVLLKDRPQPHLLADARLGDRRARFHSRHRAQ